MDYRLGMITLFAQDLPTAKAFYTDKLGLKMLPQFSNSQFVLLQLAGSAMLALQDANCLPPGLVKPAGSVEVALEVDDVEAAYAAVKANGVSVTDISDMGAGRVFRFQDTEGHMLNIYQPHPRTLDMRRQSGVEA